MEVYAIPLSDDGDSKRGRWTTEEDLKLRLAIQELGEKHWKLIAERVPARTPIQCLHRWTKILKPGLVKGPWTREEDQQVLEWVQYHGPCRWSLCAEHTPGRSGKQCRERWSNTLDPAVKKGDWNEEEDRIIFGYYKSHGPKWTDIAKMLPGRSENAIKNRFYSTIRKAKLKTAMPEKPIDVQDVNQNLLQSAASMQVFVLLRQLQKLEDMLSQTRQQIVCLEESIDRAEQSELESKEITTDFLF